MTQGTELTDRTEELNRQVHPKHYDPAKGGALSVAFTPTEADLCMSTLRGRVDPGEAFRRHTEDCKHESVGTWPVEVGHAMDLDLRCVDDGGIGDAPEDHASVDFAKVATTKGAIKQAARKLAARANELGPIHRP